MNIVTLWLKVMKSCPKRIAKLWSVQKWLKVCNSGQKWEKVVKWANRNWTRFYIELLSQSIEVLKMWPRHTQHPVSEIAIVSMVSMLFPWHFSGMIWHPGGMIWNAMEYHVIQKIAIVSMLFPWHFSGILWHPGGMLWNAM